MSDSETHAQQATQEAPEAPETPCAEFKVAMEKCVAGKGEESCKELIEAYKECMKTLGIKV